MGDSSDSDIEIVFEQLPTKDQADLAQKLMLPPNFFIYKNKPGYVSDESDGKRLFIYVFIYFSLFIFFTFP